MNILRLFVLLFLYYFVSSADDSTVKDPTLCEVCKFLAMELRSRLIETGKSKEILRTGHGLDERNKKAVEYNKSELRLTEALHDPHICEKILQYNVHAEKKGSLRFAKGRSETMETLHGLVDKGVKVELGIPYDLWDSPSAEVTQMQRQCYRLVEDYEETIEDWYYHSQQTDIMDYLCRDTVLTSHNRKCLDEEDALENKSNDKTEKSKKKSKSKGDVGKKAKKSSKEEL